MVFELIEEPWENSYPEDDDEWEEDDDEWEEDDDDDEDWD